MPRTGGTAVVLMRGTLPPYPPVLRGGGRFGDLSLSADQTAVAWGINEGEDLIHQRLTAVARANRGEALSEYAIPPEQVFERGVQQLHLRLVEATPLQADHIQAGQTGPIADDAAERDHVGLDAGHAANHGGATNTHELMDRSGPADHGMIGDRHVTTHHRIVGNDHMIADGAIMCDMRHRHQHAVAADTRNSLPGHRAAVDGTMLAHLRACTDLATRRLAGVFQVLRREAHGAEGIQYHVRTD